MSVQTRVMEDGRWTTRNLDIHQILARNREEATMPHKLPTGPTPPVLGLLTKTVVRSPIIKTIIPARVRHRSKNDVVFVFEHSIEIKEVIGGERIEEDPFSDILFDNAVVKRDFDSSIQAAKVLGLPREPKPSRFPGRFWDGEYKSQSPPETKPDPFHENEIPPQILVLSLASRLLVFLFAYYDLQEAVHFLSSTWPLPAQIPLIEELGVHLAVDPKALAVGAYENRVIFYALKTMERMRDEVQGSDGLNAAKFMPIREEKHLDVDGFILKMEFLHPSKGDDSHVILLLIVSKAQKTRLVRFEWDCRSALSALDQKPGQMLPHPERLPLLLIPLTYGTAFALVCEHQIVVYKDILAGDAKGQSCELEHYEPPEEPGSSQKLPIWTQWARPTRPAETPHSNVDNIYLCREDGVVRYIDIREDSSPMVSSLYKAGMLDANIGTAFATLDLGDESNDLLVAAGEMGDGGLWYFQPRGPLDLVGVLRNWTPLRDMVNAEVCHPAAGAIENAVTTSAKTGRLFACSGRGPRHGAITEIRVGTEAVKFGPTIDLGELGDKGVENMWTLPDRSNTGIYLMVAHPTETELILLPASNDRDPQALSRIEEFDLDVKTIAAGSTAEGFTIQVTQSSINAIAQERGVVPFTSSLSDGTITAACFLTIPLRTTILLTVVRKNDGVFFHHGHFGVQDGRIAFAELGEPLLLRSEASCVSVHWLNDRLVAFVGILTGTLQSYIANPGSSFAPLFEYSFGDQFAICESLAMITTDESTNEGAEHLLVCGLRNGTIETLAFADVDPDGTLAPYDKLEIGATSVKVMADTTRSSRAIITCERVLYTLEYLGGRGASPNSAILSKVWLTDPSNPAFIQSTLSSLTQASSKIPQGYSKFGAGSLFYLAGNTLLLADLSSSPEPDMVPRRIPLTGTPARVLYSEHLKKLIILYTITTVDQANHAGSPRNRSQRRRLQPAIAFVDPDAETVRSDLDEEDGLNVLPASSLKDGERFLGVMEWFPIDGASRYHFLVALTIFRHSAGEEATGRLLIFSLDVSRAGKVTLTLKKDRDRGDPPIWCMAPYGDSSLVYACGEDIVLQRLDMHTRQFEKPTSLTLRSRATHISVEGVVIHVSTKGSGYHMLGIADGRRLLPICADASGRSSVHHLSLPIHSLILTTDSECKVAGLWRPPQPQLGRTAPLLFEATLPGSVRKLYEVRRPTWQQKTPGIQLQPICFLGSSEDGALYQLTIIGESMWRLLAFIQNMAMRDPRICPYASPLIHEQHIEPQDTRKQNMHINGDILSRFLERGGVLCLQEMLGKEPDPDNSASDYTTADDRRRRCRELFAAVTGALEGELVEDIVEIVHTLLLSAI